MDAELYTLFGGYRNYMQTPRHIVQRHRLRLIAKGRVEYEQYKQSEKERKAADEEARRANNQRR